MIIILSPHIVLHLNYSFKFKSSKKKGEIRLRNRKIAPFLYYVMWRVVICGCANLIYFKSIFPILRFSDLNNLNNLFPWHDFFTDYLNSL